MASRVPGNQVSFVTSPEDEGRRLDQVLAARVPALSRRRARVLLDLGGVFVDGARVKMAGRPVHAGQRIVAHLGGALERATKEVGTEARARDEARLPSYAVVHEDEDLVVVDKPAGLLTAPTPESDRTNLQSLLSRRLSGSPARIYVVHRLDLDTSGLLVFAKTAVANRELGERFRRHDLLREYLGVACGAVPEALKVIDSAIRGRAALSRLTIEEGFKNLATLVRVKLETGRTHQIRIHLAVAGYPVLGDGVYGRPTDFDPPRVALHATELAFEHPRTQKRLGFTSPWPVDLAPWLTSLRERAG